MSSNIRNLIESILSEKKAKNGLHVTAIAMHIHNESINLFEAPDNSLNYEVLKKKVNAILAAEVKKKKGGKYRKVKNPKTGKNRKGYYKLKLNKITPLHSQFDS